MILPPSAWTSSIVLTASECCGSKISTVIGICFCVMLSAAEDTYKGGRYRGLW